MQKRPRTLALLACACAAVLALPAGAQKLPAAVQDMKPGLWEQSNNVSSPDVQTQATMSAIQAQLANMSPDQRKGLQQMLERNGVQMDLGAGGAITTRMCMTKEMIQRKEFPVQQGDCTQKMTPVSGARMKIAFSCSKPPASGEGELTVDSETSYRARMHIRGNDGANRQAVDMDVSGKWLGADCGTLRPISVPSSR
jgi:hypothetical protein